MSLPADPFRKKRPMPEGIGLAKTTTSSAAGVHAELHRRLAGLVRAHVGRRRVVVEVRDAHAHAVTGRARRELIHPAHADAAAAGEARRTHLYAVRLRAGTGADAAVVQVVVGVVAEPAALVHRRIARLPDPVDVVARDR